MKNKILFVLIYVFPSFIVFCSVGTYVITNLSLYSHTHIWKWMGIYITTRFYFQVLLHLDFSANSCKLFNVVHLSQNGVLRALLLSIFEFVKSVQYNWSIIQKSLQVHVSLWQNIASVRIWRMFIHSLLKPAYVRKSKINLFHLDRWQISY